MKQARGSVALAVCMITLLLAGCGGSGGGGTTTTTDTTPPTVSSTSPASSAAGIAPNAAITATFSETLAASSVTATSFTLNNGATGTVTYSGTTATFTPSSNLAYATVYTATISTAVTDVASNAMASTYTWTFTTGGLSVANLTDPLAAQQWGLHNTAQNGYADTVGVANTTGTLGTDVNVDSVYTSYGYTGKGVTVAVVDSGLEIAHEDLSANVVSGGSWNFINNSTDPTNATATTGDHGTMVSGLIAMAINGIGGVGVAPNAKLKGFNFISSSQLLADHVASLGGSTASPNSSDVFIFNQSTGTSNKTESTENATLEAQYAYGTSTLRGSKGALYVKSAGNGFTDFGTAKCSTASGGAANALGVSCQNANFDPDNTLPYNIVVAALDAKGVKVSYSSAGSTIWASAPGGYYGRNTAAYTAAGLAPPATGSIAFDPAMVTTDQSGCSLGESVSTTPTASAGPFSFFNWGGTNLSSINLNCNYTNAMNGTSSAAPMMSGVIALILEANPALTWREVKDILAKTAVQVDASRAAINTALSDGTYTAEQAWVTNAAGFKFHNWYGFGAVNGKAAVDMARSYTSGSLGIFANTGWISSGTLSVVIPDNSVAGASATLTVPSVGTSGKVEAVQIKIATTNILNGWTGDLGIELTSPSGTKSILKNIKDGLIGSNFVAMVFNSNAFYGESSTGTWTAKVVDGWSSGTQTLTNVQIRVYGH